MLLLFPHFVTLLNIQPVTAPKFRDATLTTLLRESDAASRQP